MAEEIKSMFSFASKAEVLKAKMQPEQKEKSLAGKAVDLFREQPKTVWDNPYFSLSKEEAMAQHEQGLVSDDDANDYIVANLIKDKGMWELNKEQAMYAHKRGFVNDDQAQAFVEFQTMSYDMNQTAGKYVLYEIARGRGKDDVLAELEGLAIPMYGPEDLVADLLTGGTISLMRTGLKAAAKAGAKSTVKQVGKAAVVDAAFGAAAGGAMTGAGFITDSGTVQLLSGLLTPLGASVVLGMGRNGLKQWLKGIKKNNPKFAKQLQETLADSDDDLTRLIKEELDEAVMESVTPEFTTTPAKLRQARSADILPHLEDTNVTGLERLNRVTGEESIKSVSIMKAIQEGTSGTETKPSKMIDVIESKGDVKATDLIREVNDHFADDIDKARGGKAKPGKGRVTTEKQEKEALEELNKIAEWTGSRVKDMKKVVGWGENLQEAMKTVRRQTRAFNKVFAQYTDEIGDMVDNAVSFADELRALRHIQLFGKMTRSVYGIRSEWGRGVQSYNSSWMKTKFDFDSIPAEQMRNLEKSERKRVQQVLSGFRKAKNRRMQALRARNTNRGRFMLGMLELEQAMLLSHPLTQAINIAGNLGTLTFRNAAQYAATNIDAWKIAGGWRRPLSRDELAMRSANMQIESLWTGLVDSFRLPVDQMKDAFKQSRKQKAHMGQNIGDAIMNTEAGSVWKALWSGEAQLDTFAKYAEESKGALPNDLNDILVPFGKGKTLGQTRFKLPRAMNMPIGNLIRLPFHGLTAGDELFKTVTYRQALHELSYREIMKNGGVVNLSSGGKKKFLLTPETIDSAVRFQIDNASDEMMMEALKVARRETFTNELDQFTGSIEKMLNTPHLGPLARILAIPFFKVTINLPKYALQQTPLGYLSKWQKDAIKEGGKARYEIFARWTMGTSILAAGAGLYSYGKITGRVEKGKRGSAEAANVQPYSFVDEDGTQYDYSRIEPVAYLLGMGADLARAAGDTMDYLDPVQREQAQIELEDVMMSWLSAFTAPVMEKTVATSLKEGVQLITEPDRMNLKKWKVKQVEKFMPRIMNFATEMSGHQDVMREARTVMEAWDRKWGSLAAENERAHPKRHIVYGTPVPREERAFGLVNKKDYTDDPVLQEMWAVGYNPIKLADSFTLDGIEIDLEEHPNAYDEIQDIIAASEMKDELKALIEDTYYLDSTDDKERQAMISEIVNAYRKDAREQWFDSLPETDPLYQKYEKDFQRELDISMGVKFRNDKNALRRYWSDFLNIKENE